MKTQSCLLPPCLYTNNIAQGYVNKVFSTTYITVFTLVHYYTSLSFEIFLNVDQLMLCVYIHSLINQSILYNINPQSTYKWYKIHGSKQTVVKQNGTHGSDFHIIP